MCSTFGRKILAPWRGEGLFVSRTFKRAQMTSRHISVRNFESKYNLHMKDQIQSTTHFDTDQLTGGIKASSPMRIRISRGSQIKLAGGVCRGEYHLTTCRHG
jgi:hypothetical protein